MHGKLLFLILHLPQPEVILRPDLQLLPVCAISFPPVSCMFPSIFPLPFRELAPPPSIDHFQTKFPQFEVPLQQVLMGHHLSWVSRWEIQYFLRCSPILPTMLLLLRYIWFSFSLLVVILVPLLLILFSPSAVQGFLILWLI